MKTSILILIAVLVSNISFSQYKINTIRTTILFFNNMDDIHSNSTYEKPRIELETDFKKENKSFFINTGINHFKTREFDINYYSTNSQNSFYHNTSNDSIGLTKHESEIVRSASNNNYLGLILGIGFKTSTTEKVKFSILAQYNPSFLIKSKGREFSYIETNYRLTETNNYQLEKIFITNREYFTEKSIKSQHRVLSRFMFPLRFEYSPLSKEQKLSHFNILFELRPGISFQGIINKYPDIELKTNLGISYYI